MTGFRVSQAGWYGLDGVAARPDDLRQGHGRRLPGRGVRRPRRRDGAPRPGRARLPGGHALREPGRHRRRARAAAAAATTPAYATVDAVSAEMRRLVSEALTKEGVRAPARSARATCSRCSSRDGRGPRLRGRQGAGGLPLHRVLPLDAGAGRLPAAVAPSSPGSSPPPTTTRRRRAHRRRPARRRPRGRRGARMSDSRASDAPATTTHRRPPACATARCTTRTGVLYGRLPGYHLSELGRQMADRVAEHLAGRDITYVVSSPLERAQETAAPDRRRRTAWTWPSTSG